jgi:hypothetical protein
MRNTLIPLDMIFMDETGTVTRIHENAVPLDETTIDGGDGVQAVLEINGGLASRDRHRRGQRAAPPRPRPVDRRLALRVTPSHATPGPLQKPPSGRSAVW